MKKSLLLILIVFTTLGAWSQSSKFSPITRKLIKDVNFAQQKYGNLNSLAKPGQASARIVNPSTRALARVSQNIDQSRFSELGIKINTKAGNIWSLTIPLNKIASLADIEGLEYLETDFPIQPKLEESRQLSRVDQVHQALDGLSTSYTGEGVVVGIIDYDFVLNHPAFFSEDGSQYRVSKVWLQTGFTGTPPTPYDYGAELSGATEISNLGVYSTSSGSHGTHVAGIAAGSGNGSDGTYRGFAPNAELVFVELGGLETSPTSGISGPSMVIDAVNYIFEYAASQNKPAVINMSLGTHIGPHDGTSLLEQGLDNLAGQGKILVAAAGNEGGTPLHASHTFNTEETMATAVIGQTSDDETYFSALSVWGSANTNFEINVVGLNAFTGEFTETGFLSTETSGELQVGSEDEFNNGTIDFAASVFAGPSTTGNDRPNAYIELVYNSTFNETSWVLVLVKSSDGTVHIWNNGGGLGEALTDAAQADVDESFGFVWESGNTQYTVGEFGTANEVITVGAYNTSSSGSLGEIAGFSSRGPTLDMRIKPDIVSPGNRIASAYNDQDEELTDRSDVVSTISGNDGLDYIYAYSQGTSMAAPAVAGAIALMLEAKPDLDFEEILQVFEESSNEDNFVSLETVDPLGNPKSNTWGYGKMDVLDAMLTIEEAIGSTISTNLTLTAFTVADASGSSNIVDGSQAFGTVTISNTGTSDINQMVEVGFNVAEENLSAEITINLTAGSADTYNIDLGIVEGVGDYTIMATVDPNNLLAEEDETDNELSAAFTVIEEIVLQPNLVPETFIIVDENGESPLVVGGQAFFVVNITNNGEVAVDVPFTVSYDVNGEIFTSTISESIPIAGTYEELVEVASPTESGILEVTAMLDSENVIAESNENDNSISATVTVIEETIPLPNLAPVTFLIGDENGETPLVVGGQAFFVVNITNDGEAAIELPFTVSYDINGEIFTSIITDNIPAGGSYEETVEVDSPTEPGTLVVTAMIDSENVVPESNEDDNSISATVTVVEEVIPLPNLLPTTFLIGDENGETPLLVGGQAFFVVNVTNNGEAPVEQEFTVSYDVNGEIFTSTISEIIPIAGTYEEIVEIDSPAESGTLEVTATLDSDNVIVESNENDNSISATVTIIDNDLTPDPINGTISVSIDEAEINEDIIFEVNATGGVPPYTYTWDFNITNVVLSESDNAVTVSFEGAGEIEASVTITDAEGNSETVTVTSIATISEEIVNSANDDIISILKYYPNPTKSGYFSISFNDYSVYNELKEIRIFDLQARLIPNKINREKDLLSIDISQAKPGLYIVYLHLGTDWKSFRLIRE